MRKTLLAAVFIALVVLPAFSAPEKEKPKTPIAQVQEDVAELRAEVAELRKLVEELRALLAARPGAETGAGLFEVGGFKKRPGNRNEVDFLKINIEANSVAEAVAKGRAHGLSVEEKYNADGKLEYPDVKKLK